MAMEYNKIKMLANAAKTTIKDLAGKIGMTEHGLHAAIKNETLKIRDLEKISTELNVDTSVFFDPRKTVSKGLLHVEDHQLAEELKRYILLTRKNLTKILDDYLTIAIYYEGWPAIIALLLTLDRENIINKEDTILNLSILHNMEIEENIQLEHADNLIEAYIEIENWISKNLSYSEKENIRFRPDKKIWSEDKTYQVDYIFKSLKSIAGIQLPRPLQKRLDESKNEFSSWIEEVLNYLVENSKVFKLVAETLALDNLYDSNFVYTFEER